MCSLCGVHRRADQDARFIVSQPEAHEHRRRFPPSAFFSCLTLLRVLSKLSCSPSTSGPRPPSPNSRLAADCRSSWCPLRMCAPDQVAKTAIARNKAHSESVPFGKTTTIAAGDVGKDASTDFLLLYDGKRREPREHVPPIQSMAMSEPCSQYFSAGLSRNQGRSAPDAPPAPNKPLGGHARYPGKTPMS